jgi:hypothetical protein
MLTERTFNNSVPISMALPISALDASSIISIFSTSMLETRIEPWDDGMMSSSSLEGMLSYRARLKGKHAQPRKPRKQGVDRIRSLETLGLEILSSRASYYPSQGARTVP